MKTVGLLRVKNESRWIERAVSSIMPICSTVLVMDDHSTDETPAIAKRCGAIVIDSPFTGVDETRDKNWLLEYAWEHASEGDWALMIDGDEALIAEDYAVLSASMKTARNSVSLRVLYLWDSEDSVRVDGVYGTFARPSVFRMLHRGIQFRSAQGGAHFHCGNVPVQCASGAVMSPARLLHYGYMDRQDRVRKYQWYNALDPGNQLEDGYRHVVIGDLFPAGSQFRWAGPLEVHPLCR